MNKTNLFSCPSLVYNCMSLNDNLITSKLFILPSELCSMGRIIKTAVTSILLILFIWQTFESAKKFLKGKTVVSTSNQVMYKERGETLFICCQGPRYHLVPINNCV